MQLVMFYVREPVTGITLNETTVESSMAIGKFQLVATVNPAGEGVNRNVTWTSSDTSIITVDENGLVTFVKPDMQLLFVRPKMVHLLQHVTLL